MGMDARGALAALEADGSLTWRCVDGEGRTVSPELSSPAWRATGSWPT